MPNIEIIRATVDDAALILKFVNELATYVKAKQEVVATESDIRNSLFGESSTTQAVVCHADGEVICDVKLYYFA